MSTLYIAEISLEAVSLKLIDAGYYHVTDAIRSCKKESMRPGVLRVLRAVPEVKREATAPLRCLVSGIAISESSSLLPRGAYTLQLCSEACQVPDPINTRKTIPPAAQRHAQAAGRTIIASYLPGTCFRMYSP